MGLFPGNHSPTEGRRDNVPQASFSSKSSSRPALALVCPHQPSHQQLPPPLQLLFPAGDTDSQAGARVSQLLNHDGIFPSRWRHVVAGDKCSTSCGLGLVVVVGVFPWTCRNLFGLWFGRKVRYRTDGRRAYVTFHCILSVQGRMSSHSFASFHSHTANSSARGGPPILRTSSAHRNPRTGVKAHHSLL